MTKTNSSAKPAGASTSTSTPFDAADDAKAGLSSRDDVQTRSSDDSAGNHADKEDDDTCCGDACTSKTCKRALKALDFDLSDHSSHGH